MKRRYKLLLIILIGSLLTLLIYFREKESRVNLVAIGDGLAQGMTAYNVVGLSFNDYLSQVYENKNNLNSFNKEFSWDHLTIDKLNYLLNTNALSPKSKIPIKQIIEQADILTIAIGLDDFADISLRTHEYDKYINDYINNYKSVLATIRSFYSNKIIILGIYPAYNLDKNTVITINQHLQKLAFENDAKFLDLLSISLNRKYYLLPTSYYLSYEAHQKIAKDILPFVK